MANLETILAAIESRAAGHDRFIVGIAGPPGAGKSTLSADLVRRLPNDTAAVVPMDGFHYDNAVLDALGLRRRKGAPETFDYAGLAILLERLRRGESEVAIPIFDREADLARAAGAIIHRNVKFIVVEGNYLLLDEAPWTGLSKYFDATIFINVARDELQRRLLQRWLALGYSQTKAEHWLATNDMHNVDRVLARLRSHDFTFS